MIQPIINNKIATPCFRGRYLNCDSNIEKLICDYTDDDVFKHVKKILPPENLDGLQRRSIRMIEAIDDIIQNVWSAVKQKKKFTHRKGFKNIDKVPPEFEYSAENNTVVTLKPLYNNSYENNVLFGINKPDSIETMRLDRHGKYYRYENAQRTQYGYITTKTYDSRKSGNNPEISQKIDNYIQNYMKEIIIMYRKYLSDPNEVARKCKITLFSPKIKNSSYNKKI